MTFRNRLRTGVTVAAVTATLGVGPLVAFWGAAAPAAGSTAGSPAVSAQVAQPGYPCIPQLMWCNKD